MKYMRALTYVFDNPRWWYLLLVGGLSFIVPVVGIIVFMGYLAITVERFHQTRDDAYEDFDFSKLETYLVRGIWPFLANVFLGVVMLPAYLLAFIVPRILGAVLDSKEIMFIGFGIGMILYMLVAFAGTFFWVPMVIAGALGQSFKAILSWAFIKDFAWKMKFEIFLALLFTSATGTVLGLAGMLLCCIGMYPAIALVIAMQWHLHWQLYELYLTRGGIRITGDDLPEFFK
jgi:hypothetical protein